jgi:hypothetical protein
MGTGSVPLKAAGSSSQHHRLRVAIVLAVDLRCTYLG